ncbi:MAG: RelA/SpoT family protein, partial [Undibacterium sp.]|nr:RelA/SpoT family protein [Undibacterium sp.]
AMSAENQRRIARESMEVYVPFAHRLGLNIIYRVLQDLAFAHIYPMRYRTLSKAVKSARGNRREVVNKIMQSVTIALAEAGLNAQVYGREKTLYGIYCKMRDKQLSFSQVLDVYGFRIVVDNFPNSYFALGTLHALYKPMPGKFKDYIAIPKSNGYQSLHTTLIGPYGTPVEFQIRTQDMHHVAESGVAAHWLYKNEEGSLTDLQQRTHAWLQSLLDIQKQTGDSAEFLEHIKIDLFPDSVYVFTPKSKIIALPRGATALDFAYTIHTDIGDQAIATRINNEPVPLRSELKNGDIIEIITSSNSRPTPNWLTYVRTGKARSAIRHYLRTINLNESTELGKQLLAQALVAVHLNPELPESLVDKLLNESSANTLEEIHTDIGIGKRMAALVARHILDLVEDDSPSIPFQLFDGDKISKPEPVIIYGSEGVSVQLAPCCLPIPGDGIIGQLKRDQGLVVHKDDCINAIRMQVKEPDRWIDVSWGEDLNRRFDCRITVMVNNQRGALARIAAEIGESDVNISHVSMEDGQANDMTNIHFTIQVESRTHLARLIRNVKHLTGVSKIWRVHL